MTSRDTIRRRYDVFAKHYDEVFVSRQVEKLKCVQKFMPNGCPERALDAGGGTGIAARFFGYPFVNLDVSQGMLRYADGHRVQADICALPFAQDTFDLILSLSVLKDSTPIDRALTEFHRVLKPGGLLVLSILKTEDLASAEVLVKQTFNRQAQREDLGPDLGFIVEKVR
ncbi:MAG: class I SAM-dependent methyltransferase [Myxococcota bacterium]|nr:class I SAM-dependent methyltransferase [Myxococcota bacterium]